MDPVRVLSLARRIVTQCVRDKRTFALIIIVPSLVMALLGYFYTTSSSNAITIGVVDQGVGPLKLSSFVVDQLRLQPNTTVVPLGPGSPDQAIKDKMVDAAVTFSKDFTAGVMSSRQANLAIVSEGTDQMKTMTASRAVGNAAMAAVSSKLQSGNGTAAGSLLNLDSRVIYASTPRWTCSRRTCWASSPSPSSSSSPASRSCGSGPSAPSSACWSRR
jgi:ABC-2 type transport system permease protein